MILAITYMTLHKIMWIFLALWAGRLGTFIVLKGFTNQHLNCCPF